VAARLESLIVASSSHRVEAHLKLIRNETNLHLARTLQMCREVDVDARDSNESLERLVRAEVDCYLDAESFDPMSESGAVCASIRLQHYLLHLYSALGSAARDHGFGRHSLALEVAYEAKQTRLMILKAFLEDLEPETSTKAKSVRRVWPSLLLLLTS